MSAHMFDTFSCLPASGQTARLLVRSAVVQVNHVLLVVCVVRQFVLVVVVVEVTSRSGAKYDDMAREDDCFYYDTN